MNELESLAKRLKARAELAARQPHEFDGGHEGVLLGIVEDIEAVLAEPATESQSHPPTSNELDAVSDSAVRKEAENLRLRQTLESIEMMLGYPAEHPEAFELESLRVTVKATHGILVMALRNLQEPEAQGAEKRAERA